jgi:predicted extracellular nuclease
LNSCSIKYPALLLGCLISAACSESGQPPGGEAGLCLSSATPIPAIQGQGYSSPLEGSDAVARGIVTRVRAGEGFYLESSSTEPSAQASKALFVADVQLSRTVSTGQEWTVGGNIAELGSSRDTMTSITQLTGWELCGSGGFLQATQAMLPMNAAQREALEGMRLSFSQPLTVSDVYNLHRGELTLSAGGILRVPTENVSPGDEAAQLARRNRAQSLTAVVPDSESIALPVGSGLNGASGLLGHDGRKQQFYLDTLPVEERPASQALRPPGDGHLRIVSSNLLNFFNGDGQGGGFPTARGAETLPEFEAQSGRILAAVRAMRPDLLAVQELENDGFGPNSAANALLTLLNRAGADDWAVIDPGQGRIGGDVITVGIFYRRQALSPSGPAHLLDSPEFDGLSRRPLTQLFRDNRSGRKFLVSVNHLKSKGRCPEAGENADLGDGQGCWNAARTAAVNALVPWLEDLASAAGTAHVLVLGDLNAWRLEDPIRRFGALQFDDLVAKLSGLPQHSYLYWGQLGTLDYAFATPALTALAVHAQNWNINSEWTRLTELAEPWLRFSDHDPVVVDFDFSQAETSD